MFVVVVVVVVVVGGTGEEPVHVILMLDSLAAWRQDWGTSTGVHGVLVFSCSLLGEVTDRCFPVNPHVTGVGM